MMGVTLCEVHGRQGIALVCPHVAERYHRRSDANGILPVWGKWIDSHDEIVQFWCCDPCALQYGLGIEQQPVDYLEIVEDFHTTPICYACFDAWREGKQ
jgi:hypothetical protein